MPFPMRIQPIDSIQNDAVKPPPPPVSKSRLKRFFDRPFTKFSAAAEKPNSGGETEEFEPSSVCLDRMVQIFIEDNNEKQSMKCGRNRCNCFHGNSNDSSDDEHDFLSDSLAHNSSFCDPTDTLKSLTQCASAVERDLLADTWKIVETNNNKTTCKRKDELTKTVTDSLIALGYDASVCKSKWEKSSSIPAGEYEYIDVMIGEEERLLIDVDFRSEFEIARSTSGYKAMLQSLPYIFVGKSDRLLQIVSMVSEAARQSLKKKGMHIAPWRKSEYIKSKWLSPYARVTPRKIDDKNDVVEVNCPESESEIEIGELDLIFGEKVETKSPEVAPVATWQLPAVKPKSGRVVVTGLAALLTEQH